MNETNYDKLIARLLAEDISSTEKQTLFAWVEADEANRRLLEEAKVFWKESENYGNDLNINTAKAWDKFELFLEEEEEEAPLKERPVRKMKTASNWKLFSRAAAILLLMGMAYWWYATPSRTVEQLIVFQTNDQEQKELKLPDGSIVWLNENSSLSYQANFENRLVNLAGEGLFDIVKKEGKKFEIQSGQARTTVLGTQFNVRAYPIEERIEVTVVHGKVALSAIDRKKEIFLEAGDIGILHEKETRLSKNETTNDNATAWKTKQLIFQDLKLNRIFQDLERHFDVNLSTQNQAILNCAFTGNFEEKSLDDILRFIQLATGIIFERNGNEIIVKGEGC